jgi:hypothetical protein
VAELAQSFGEVLADRKALAMIVKVGFTAPIETKKPEVEAQVGPAWSRTSCACASA